jgi:hypothetical protein
MDSTWAAACGVHVTPADTPPRRRLFLRPPSRAQTPELLASEGNDAGVVRGITGAVARRLAAAEAGELVRCMASAAKARRAAAAAAMQAEMW